MLPFMHILDIGNKFGELTSPYVFVHSSICDLLSLLNQSKTVTLFAPKSANNICFFFLFSRF